MDTEIDKSKPHARIFAIEAQRINAGYVDGNVNDSPAINGDIKIGLVYHGTKNLTVAQQRNFA